MMYLWFYLTTLLTLISGATPMFWDEDVPNEHRFKVREKFVNAACSVRDSVQCKDLHTRYWSPKMVQPPPNTTTVIVKPPTPDPCAEGLCFDWKVYREQTLYPFAEQILEQNALSRFEDDKQENSLFSAKNFKAWFEAMSLPPDHQSISAETSGNLALKLVTTGLAQARLARVEALDNSGMTWQTAVSLPGCAVLLIYLIFSMHQLKSLWKQRCARNETQKNAKLLDHLLQRRSVQDMEKGAAVELRPLRSDRF
jgi:hypothetical protein